MKFSGDISQVQINQYTVIDNAEMNNYTYYVSPLMVVGTEDYTKHYYIEGQRFMSKIGGGMANGLTPLFANNTGIDLKQKWDKIVEQLENSVECLGLNGNVVYDGINMEWLHDIESYSNPEEDLYFYHPDHLGSSSFITDATGEPTQHLEYLPFGELFIEERSTWNTPYKFSGKELDDETGYSYFGARYYDPNISIWLSVDPLADKALGLTPYRYAMNNPIRLIDPNGMFEDVYITGPEANAAREQLQQATSLKISRDQKTGKLSASGVPVTKNDQQLLSAINDKGIDVHIYASNSDQTSTGEYSPGGAFMGNKINSKSGQEQTGVKPFETTSLPGVVSSIDAFQEVNPGLLGNIDNYYNKPGGSMLHEVTEAYEGAKISLSTGISSPRAGQPGSVFSAAHQAATKPPGDVFHRGLDRYKNPISPGSGLGVYYNQFYLKSQNRPERVLYTY